MSDFKISMKQLYHTLNNYDEIPYTALIYLTGECYYGGKVTDDHDRRTILTLLKDFYNPLMVNDDKFFFSQVEDFYIPESMNLVDSLEWIDTVREKERDREIFFRSETIILFIEGVGFPMT